MKIKITSEYITLGQLLKLCDFISSGAEAKEYLLYENVLVNEELEKRRGRKIYAGDIVNINGESIYVS